MKSRKLVILSFVALSTFAVVSVVIYLPADFELHSADGNHPDKIRIRSYGAQDRQNQSNRRVSTRESRHVTDAETGDRKRIFEDLKSRWVELGTKSDMMDDFSEREELGRNCARQLLFSNEFFELEKYLKDHDIVTDRKGGGLSMFLYDGLKYEFANELRDSYMDFVSSKAAQGADRYRIESFADHLGRHSTPEDFTEFYNQLDRQEPPLAQEFLFGFTEEQASKNPANIVGVVEDLVELIDTEIVSNGSPKALVRIIQHVDEKSDFPAIERALDSAENANIGIDIEGARRELVFRWAAVDPMEVTNRILNDSNKYPAALMEFVGTIGYSTIENSSGSNAANEWIKSLPSGDLRNRAIYGAARSCYLDDSAKARQIANFMSSEDREVYFSGLPSLK